MEAPLCNIERSSANSAVSQIGLRPEYVSSALIDLWPGGVAANWAAAGLWSGTEAFTTPPCTCARICFAQPDMFMPAASSDALGGGTDMKSPSPSVAYCRCNHGAGMTC
jgi:hypothetical protein